MSTTLIVGNPKPASRTRDAGERLVAALTDAPPTAVIELSELGPGLLGWGDPGVRAAVETVAASDLVVFACPTFKATYTGLLKIFLDQFAGGTGLAGVVCVPLMLGAGPQHALAPEGTLRPVLSELGGTCALPGLYLVDSAYADSDDIAIYAARWRSVVDALAPVSRPTS